MKFQKIPQKILTFAVILTLPFLVSCATSKLSNELEKGGLSYEVAQQAIADGANVNNGYFMELAFLQRRFDLIKLFVENGASCFTAPSGNAKSSFSLFKSVVYGNDQRYRRFDLLDLCLSHVNDDPVPANEQISEFVRRVNFSDSDQVRMLLKIKAAGFETDKIPSATELLRERVCGPKEISLSVSELISLGADVTITGGNGNSLLYFAGYRGTPEMIKELQFAGAKMSAEEATELLLDCVVGQWRIVFDVSELIELGANPNAKDENGNSLLFVVASRGDAEIARELQGAGAKISADEATELLISKVCGNEKIQMGISDLANFGADVNAKTKEGKSLLLVAVSNENENFEKELVAAGAKMSADEATELLISKVCGNEKIQTSISDLANFGADVNTKDEEGNSLLFISTSRGDIEAAKELLFVGAKMSVEEATKLLISKIHGNEQIAFSVPELVELGADPNAKDGNGNSLLFVAACGNAEVAKELLFADAAMSADEATKLLLDRIGGNEQIAFSVSVLVEVGADLNVKDGNGNSILYLVASRGNAEVAKELQGAGAKMSDKEATELLISKIHGNGKIQMSVSDLANFGADVNAKTKAGKPLLFVAISNENERFEKELIAAGAKETDEIVALREHIAERKRQIAEQKRKEEERIAQRKKIKAIENYFEKIQSGKWDEISRMIKNEDWDISVVHPTNNENGFHQIASAIRVYDGSLETYVDESFVRALERAGANINLKNSQGFSPLRIAITKANSPAVRLLLKYGANPYEISVFKERFGDLKKSLTDYAIERHNYWIGRYNKAYDLEDAYLSANYVKAMKEIVDYISQEAGEREGIREVGDFSK